MTQQKFDGTQGNGYQPLPTTYGRLHNALQDHFGRIEESGRVMRKLSLYLPVMNADILDELKEVKRRVDRLITAFETIEQDEEHPMRFL